MVFIERKVIPSIYKDKESLAFFEPLIARLEGDFVAKGATRSDAGFVALLFLKPVLTRNLQLVCARTLADYFRAVRAGDPKLVREHFFFVFYRPDVGVAPTRLPFKPAAYDLPIPEIKTVKDSERRTLAMIHTHPPLDDLLSPSVLIGEGVEAKGDLRAFYALRSGESFAEDFLSIILQQDLERDIVKVLILREGKELQELSEEQYMKRLRANKQRVGEAQSEAEVCATLRSMGYLTAYIEAPIGEFFSYPLIDPDVFKQAIRDLEFA